MLKWTARAGPELWRPRQLSMSQELHLATLAITAAQACMLSICMTAWPPAAWSASAVQMSQFHAAMHSMHLSRPSLLNAEASGAKKAHQILMCLAPLRPASRSASGEARRGLKLRSMRQPAGRCWRRGSRCMTCLDRRGGCFEAGVVLSVSDEGGSGSHTLPL